MENKIKPKEDKKDLKAFFNHFSSIITKITGGVYAFIIAIVVVVIWAVTGPFLNFQIHGN